MIKHLDLDSTTDPIFFPPIPLATGQRLLGAEGTTHSVTGVTVLIHTDSTDGPVETPLEFRFGGWWAPVSPAKGFTGAVHGPLGVHDAQVAAPS